MYASVLLAAPAFVSLVAAFPANFTRPTGISPADLSKTVRSLAPRDTGVVAASPAAVTSINDQDGIGAGVNTHTAYSGDGSSAAGWPTISQWVSFEDMFNNNQNNFQNSCASQGLDNNSPDEISSIRNAVEQVAADSAVDHRFILAIILKESTGCVRVKTTIDTSGTIANPGLMQDHMGYFSCNTNGAPNEGPQSGVTSPCPQDTITGMVREGTQGTNAGDGLAALINSAQNSGTTDAQTFYYAAQWYNMGQGTPPVGGDLSQYAIDVANFLTGWTN